MTLDIDDYKTIRWTVSKGVGDYFWVLKAKIEKHEVPPFYQTIKATALDHQGIRRTPFFGIIPAIDYTIKAAANKANIVGYDYAWYLTVQNIPESMETIDIDQNPSKTIADLLGGTDWEKTTGIEPYRCNDVTAWDAADPIKKQFTFKEQTTRWSAIVEIADYCNFVFVVKWRELTDGTMRPCAYFVHEDDIDTGGIGLDLPEEMTVDAPDNYLINDVEVKDEPLYKYNRVICTGYNPDTYQYFSSVAQTAEVAAGTELPREYTYTDASLNTKDKTEKKAQQLLEDFQSSSIIYRAKFLNRMDLELYQTVSLGGYPEIDSGEMRITKITYSRRAADDTVEIEFCKNQSVQQLKRLQQVMKSRIHYETLISDMWEKSGFYSQLIKASPINMNGWGLYNTTSVSGPRDSDVSLWGYDKLNEMSVEIARWKHHATKKNIDTYLEIKQNLFINNDEDGYAQKIYFDITKGEATWIQATKYIDRTLDMIVGGDNILTLKNPEDSETAADRTAILRSNLVMEGRIEGAAVGEEQYSSLKFWDGIVGYEVTLSDLVGGSGMENPMTVDLSMGNHKITDLAPGVEGSADAARMADIERALPITGGEMQGILSMGGYKLTNVPDPTNDQDAANKQWCEANFSGGGLTNPMTEHLYMGGYDIKDCDDIDCDDISCTGLALEGYTSRINFNTGYISNLRNIAMEGYSSYIKDIAYIDFWARNASDPPSSPTGGMLWYDGNNAVFKYYTGTVWKTITAT